MTLLSICRSACATAPVALPTSIVGSDDETANLLLALANDAGDELARRPQGGWVNMIREFDFTTVAIPPQPGTIATVNGVGVISGLTNTTGVSPGIWQVSGPGVPNNAIVTGFTPTSVTFNQPATSVTSGEYSLGQSDYPLPADFQRSIDNTFWDRSRFWQMRGPLSPQQWQVYKSSIIGNASIQRRFRFRSIRRPAANSDFTNDLNSDFSGVGNTILSQFISIDPNPLDNGAQLVFEYVSNGWCQSANGAPQVEWLADSDIGVLDEYLLRLSLKYRLLRRLGLSYSEELDEFERQVDKAQAVDGGAAILDMTPGRGFYLGYGNVPESGFGGPGPGFGFGAGGFGGSGF